MTIATIATRLAKIENAITGIKKAYDLDEMPNTLVATQLPAIVNIPAEGTYEYLSAGEIIEHRTWRVMLFVTPIERPTDAGKKSDMVQPFFRRMITAFVDAQMLDDLSGIAWAPLRGDDGLDALEYGGVIYAGVEFTLETQEWVNLTAST